MNDVSLSDWVDKSCQRYKEGILSPERHYMTAEKMRKVYEKHGGRCAYCGYMLSMDADIDDPLKGTIDHVKSQKDGGTDGIDNLLPSCYACNHVKDDMTLSEFRDAILTGKAKKKGKNKEVAELRTPRYMIPYGKYTGVTGYMWGGKFYFEKSEAEKKACREIADKVRPYILGTAVPDTVIEDFFKGNGSAVYGDSKPLSKQVSETASRIKKKIIIVSGDTKSSIPKMNVPGAPIIKPKTVPAVKPAAKLLPSMSSSGENVASHSKREALYAKMGYKCGYCGCVLICRSNKYGHSNAVPSRLDPKENFTADNTVASCQNCNSLKGNNTLTAFRNAVFSGRSTGKSKTDRYIENNYKPFKSFVGLSTANKFYFEHDEKHKAKIDDYWMSVPLKDSYNKEAPAALPQTAPSAEPAESLDELLMERKMRIVVPRVKEEELSAKYDIPNVSAVAEPLKKELKELIDKQTELVNEANRIGTRIRRIQAALSVLGDLDKDLMDDKEPDEDEVLCV